MTLPDPVREVLLAVAGGILPWREPGHVAVTLGWRYGPTLAVIESLAREGLVEVWSLAWRPEPFVTLTPLAAELMGLDLVELGHDSVPTWRDRAAAPTPIREPRDPALDGRPYPRDVVERLGSLTPPPPPKRPRSQKAKRRRSRPPRPAA